MDRNEKAIRDTLLEIRVLVRDMPTGTRNRILNKCDKVSVNLRKLTRTDKRNNNSKI